MQPVENLLSSGASMSVFSAICFAFVGILFAALCVLLITSWRGKKVGGYLIAACFASAAWAIALSVKTATGAIPLVVMFVLDVLRGGAWLAFMLALLGQLGVSRVASTSIHLLWVGVLAAGIAMWLNGASFGDQNGSLGQVAIPGGLLIALCGLILIEQLYRNTPADSRDRLRSLALGLGGMFSYDLFLYSQGMVTGEVDETSWLARGAVNIVFVPLIAVAARRNPDWELNIFVSRQVVFYTTSLMAIGVYLLLMSLGGYVLVIYGGTWGELAQIVFVAVATLVLFVLLFSVKLRARAKVFLSKHFFHNKYDYRKEWLRLIATLTGFESSSTRQIVVKAVAQIVNSPGGNLWTLNDDNKSYQLAASYESDDVLSEIAVESELVAFIKKEGWLIDLEEYSGNPSLYGGLQIPEWLVAHFDAWLIVPLMFRQNLLGLVMLRRAPGPPKLNYEDRDLLKTVGNHLAVHLAQEKSDNLLAEAQQFEAYNRLTAFLMHDLNNLIAQQSLIIRNAEKHKRNPDFVDDAMRTIAGSVERMKRVMDQLKRREADRVLKNIELRFVVSAAIDRCSGKEPVPTLTLDAHDVFLAVDAEQFTMVLAHLIKNAQDATSAEGSVNVRVVKDGSVVSIAIEDSGCGMTAEFIRDHLFRPFDSTKGSQGMGIGAYQAREFARRMGGDLRVVSKVNAGSTITMTLPMPGPSGM